LVKLDVKLACFGIGYIGFYYSPFAGLGLKSQTKALSNAAI
jgi:hypothetical protein